MNVDHLGINKYMVKGIQNDRFFVFQIGGNSVNSAVRLMIPQPNDTSLTLNGTFSETMHHDLSKTPYTYTPCFLCWVQSECDLFTERFKSGSTSWSWIPLKMGCQSGTPKVFCVQTCVCKYMQIDFIDNQSQLHQTLIFLNNWWVNTPHLHIQLHLLTHLPWYPWLNFRTSRAPFLEEQVTP